MRHALLALAALLLATASPVRDPAFDETAHPPTPDYAKSASWAVRGAGQGAADVFYIHPTTYNDRDRWNQDIADAAVNDRTMLVAGERQLGAFAACCRLFMPRYRQASSRAFAEGRGEGQKAYRFAYEDVRRAFRDYLATDNKGRPFIIAGHSQGAQATMWLLADEVAGKPIAKQLVAAYPIGVPVPVRSVEPELPGLHVCKTPADTGCVAAWNAFTADARSEPYAGRVPAGDTPICSNPLSFDERRPAAPPAANRGSLPGLPAPGPRPALVAGKVGARCDGGMLRVELAEGAPAVTPLPGGSLHMYDIELFWRNLSDNAVARVGAFANKR